VLFADSLGFYIYKLFQVCSVNTGCDKPRKDGNSPFFSFRQTVLEHPIRNKPTYQNQNTALTRFLPQPSTPAKS
jgi:hypothetical protein